MGPARSMRAFLPGARNSSIMTSWTVVTAFQIAKGHCTRNLSFGSIANDNETNTNTEPHQVQPRSVPVHVAHELHRAGHRYLDVRTHDEFITGHPFNSTNIPYMFKDGAGMFKNSKFLQEVSSQFEKEDEIIVGCKSGRRSLMAASDMQCAGFTRVTDVAGGYDAWTEHGLPISCTNQKPS